MATLSSLIVHTTYLYCQRGANKCLFADTTKDIVVEHLTVLHDSAHNCWVSIQGFHNTHKTLTQPCQADDHTAHCNKAWDWRDNSNILTTNSETTQYFWYREQYTTYVITYCSTSQRYFACVATIAYHQNVDQLGRCCYNVIQCFWTFLREVDSEWDEHVLTLYHKTVQTLLVGQHFWQKVDWGLSQSWYTLSELKGHCADIADVNFLRQRHPQGIVKVNCWAYFRTMFSSAS